MALHGGGVPADRREVVAALRSHGLSADAAAALWMMTRRLTADSRRRGREYSVMVDAEFGVRVGPTLSGEAHRLDMHRHIAACRVGRQYGHLHTHPSNGSFSES